MSVGFRSLLAGVLGRYEGLAALPVTTIDEPDGFSTAINNIWSNVSNTLGLDDTDNETGYNVSGNNLQSNKSSELGFHDTTS